MLSSSVPFACLCTFVLCVQTAGKGLCVSLRVCCCMFFVMLLFRGFAWMVMVYVCRSKSWNSAIKVHLHLCIFLCDVSFECLRGWWELMCAAPKVEMEQC